MSENVVEVKETDTQNPFDAVRDAIPSTSQIVSAQLTVGDSDDVSAVKYSIDSGEEGQPKRPDFWSPFSPLNFTEAKEFSALMAQANCIPTSFNGNPGNVLMAIMKAWSMRVDIGTAIHYMFVVNNRLDIYAEMVIALVIRHDRRNKLGVELVKKKTPDGKEILEAVCKGLRYENGQTFEARFDEIQAQEANLFKNPVWKTQPELMLQWRALRRVAKILFADILLGMNFDEIDPTSSDQDAEKMDPASLLDDPLPESHQEGIDENKPDVVDMTTDAVDMTTDAVDMTTDAVDMTTDADLQTLMDEIESTKTKTQLKELYESNLATFQQHPGIKDMWIKSLGKAE